ncbi:unnamed protein product, partial [Vitis vinifera]
MHSSKPTRLTGTGRLSVVRKLRKVGAIILGKASLSEWAGSRFATPYGWCARAGQGRNPYVLSETPCGSSSGSAISVAANLAAVSLGTETDGSILYPSHINSLVWFQSLLGRTLLVGIIQLFKISNDDFQPICRTVSDAVEVLDVIVVRNPFYMFENGCVLTKVFEHHFHTLRARRCYFEAEFKISLNAYLKELVASPVRTLADVIAFNNKFSHLEKIKEYGQDSFLRAEATKGISKKTLLKLARLSRNGFKKLMNEHKLDALVTPGADVLEDSPELLFQLDMIAKECHLAFV